jgi:hypothetical protein
MSTRSNIGYLREDGKIEAVYCHFDGYPSGVGETLVGHFNNLESAKKIVSLGDLSSVAGSVRIDPVHSHSYDKPEKETIVAYHRDRGEDYRNPTIFNDEQDYASNFGEEYAYLFKRGRWYVSRGDLFVTVKKALKDGWD